MGYMGRVRKFWAVWIAVLLFIAVLGPGTESLLAAHASDPFEIAAEHAGMAARVRQLSLIHLHLQHVLNCLEGSKGRDYRKVAGNPCTGVGALQTLPTHSANRIRARKAIALARVGITLHDFLPAHYLTQAIHAVLTESKAK